MPPEIVEGHLHLWDSARFRYPWMEEPHLGTPKPVYGVEDYVRECEGLDVIASVHVQAEVDHAIDPVDETAWLAGLAAARPSDPVPTACMGYAELRADDVSDVLDRHQEHSIFRGIRQNAWFDPNTSHADILDFEILDDPDWMRGLQLLSERNLAFDLLIFRRQLLRAAEVFSALPDLRVILDHFALPELTDSGLAEWKKDVRRFAATVPQSMFKISGLSFISNPWTEEQIRPLLHEALEIFGPERCFFSGNWPVESVAGTYFEFWDALDSMTADLSQPERRGLFSENAARTYKLELS